MIGNIPQVVICGHLAASHLFVAWGLVYFGTMNFAWRVIDEIDKG